MWEYKVGHVIDVLRTFPSESVQCVPTSPPYWGLRVYAITKEFKTEAEADDWSRTQAELLQEKYGNDHTWYISAPSTKIEEEEDIYEGDILNGFEVVGKRVKVSWHGNISAEVIWGGADGCKHEWGKKGKKHRGGPAGNSICTMGRDQSARDESRDIYTGEICLKCGAWKGAFGLEPTIELYVEHTVLILREIRRVLRKDGVVFWNIGDSYTSGNREGHGTNVGYKQETNRGASGKNDPPRARVPDGLKPKDLCMIPFRVALAVQADGWWVRSDIIWSKPNPMPESVTDRPTKSHEYIFLFTKSEDYYWDYEAVRERQGTNTHPRGRGTAKKEVKPGLGIKSNSSFNRAMAQYTEVPGGRNIRSVWTIITQSYSEAHFATFPEEIPRRCILAGTSPKGQCPKCGMPWVRIIEREAMPRNETRTHSTEGQRQGKTPCPEPTNGVTGPTIKTLGWEPQCTCNLEPIPCIVVDPFCGSGTTLRVARDLGRDAIGIDVSNNYKELAEKRADLKIPDITKFGEQMSE